MLYVYDILLNFNKDIFEYFEWEETDKIKYVKKIVLYKVTKDFINDLFHKEIIINDNFIDKIPKYEMNGSSNNKICLFSDGLIVIGVLFKNNVPYLYSRLLIDEEKEILDDILGLSTTNIDYSVIKFKKLETNNLTRTENKIKQRLELEIKELYKNKKLDKLIYLYYEYTNKENNNINHIYKYLLSSLDNFNEKHKHLNEILLMSNKK